jgi:hypothetical protein
MFSHTVRKPLKNIANGYPRSFYTGLSKSYFVVNDDMGSQFVHAYIMQQKANKSNKQHQGA